MKDVWKLALGVVTSIAGFIEVGSMSTSAQAGADYRFRLLWAVGLATICLMLLTAMSGHLPALLTGMFLRMPGSITRLACFLGDLFCEILADFFSHLTGNLFDLIDREYPIFRKLRQALIQSRFILLHQPLLQLQSPSG